MVSSVVVHRYASALADVVLSPDSGVEAPRAVEQLQAFREVLSSSADLRAVLTTPAIPAARKRAVIKDLADKLGMATVVRNLVLVVNDHGRFAALSQIANAFEEVLDERMGLVRAQVSSAFPLDRGQEGELAGQLGKLAGAQVRLRFTVDPDLIGGVTARIGSKVYDGSVRGQLADMRARLMSNR